MTTKNIEQIKEQRQSVVQLAIFNLESITDVADLQMTANQIQHYLNVYGNTSLQQLKKSFFNLIIRFLSILYGTFGIYSDLFRHHDLIKG